MKLSDERFRIAIVRILRPLARLLVRFGVSYPEFEALAKSAFVDTVTRDYGRRGRPANVSRVASIVGLSRKEVSRIRQSGISADWYPETHMSPYHRVFHYWQHDRDYSDSPTRPKRLPLYGETSFETLVKRYAGDLPVGAVKKELESRGAMYVDQDGWCILKSNFLRYSEDQEDLIHWILFSVRNLLETVEFNSRIIAAEERNVVSDLSVRRFERSVWTRQLTQQGIVSFNEWLDRHGQAFLESANEYISDCEVESDANALNSGAIGVGVYFYQQDSSND